MSGMGTEKGGDRKKTEFVDYRDQLASVADVIEECLYKKLSK